MISLANTELINAHAVKQGIGFRKGERTLKKLIWGYFILLIFEGALRKWVLPALASPLLIVRDPVGIAMIFVAIRYGWLKMNFYVLFVLITSFISLCLTFMVGHGNVGVAMYGLRITIIHFPLIFIFGKVFDKKDVIQLGSVLLQMAIPMTILMAMQFYSPQSAWVNRGVGGDVTGGGFSGALGYFRPPGTFSFINGLTAFYGLVAAFTFFYLLDNKTKINKWLVYIATACVLMAIPLSISRSLLGEVVISSVFAIAMVSRNPKLLGQILLATIVLILVVVILSTTSIFQTSTEVFMHRFESANNAEGGAEGVLIDRFLGGMYGAITNSEKLPFWGYGLGMGTNAGARLMTGNRATFLISEGEWGRIIGEMGLLLGMILVLVRVILGINLLRRAFKSLKSGNFLPWMILSFSFLSFVNGQWAQPTSLGFSILSTGLTMAALKTPKKRIWNEDNSY